MKLALSLNAKVTALTLLLLPILILLGSWQLQRAEDKRSIAAEYHSRQQQQPVPIDSLKPEGELAFVPVSARGQFDNEKLFLLDNRVRDGQLGYEVVSPFRTESGLWVLINRGWIKAEARRQDLPAIPELAGKVSTWGSVYVPPSDPFLLAEQVFEQPEWPLVVQAVEVDKFSRLLGRDFFPHVVRLDEGAPGALLTDWQPINVQPEKHSAYALQWFAMAFALVLWFIFANTNIWQLVRHSRQRGN